MKKQIIRITEYSSKLLEGIALSTEESLFNTADKLREHYRADVLKCQKNRAGDVLVSTSSFVGVVNIDESLTIEVIPKISTTDDNKSLHNLFFMMSYSGKADIPHRRLSTLEAHSGSFFEMLIAMFAEELQDKIQNATYHAYITQEENRTYLRGKLLLNDHLKRNSTMASRFYTRIDEFTANNLLNQTLKYVALGLYKVTNDKLNKKRLRICLALFDDVDSVHVTYSQAKKIHVNRMNKRFEGLLKLSLLFLANQTLASTSDKNDAWTILIDMNVLFEDFIGKALINGLHGTNYSVVEQGPRSKFVRNIEDDRSVFMMKPDISILTNGTIVRIGDTKYKKLVEDNSKYGVSQADLYQMFAYSRNYLAPDITLIYPKTNNVSHHTLELPDQTTVHIRSIDLDRNLRKEINQIESEVVQLFQRDVIEAQI